MKLTCYNRSLIKDLVPQEISIWRLFYKTHNRPSSDRMSSLTEGAEDIGDESDPGLVAENNKWAAAVERLCAEDRERFAFAETLERDPSKVLVDVLAATNKKKEECMKRRWKLVIKGGTIILRDVLEKISVWVTKVKEIGDIAVSYDPTHAALPWAAIRFILQASFNDVEVFGYVLHSIESITNAIAVGAIFELRYLRRHQTKYVVQLGS